jgi:hypothetical protein
MIDLYYLGFALFLTGCALGAWTAMLIRDGLRLQAEAAHKAQVAELNEEIVRVRAFMAQYVGTEPK